MNKTIKILILPLLLTQCLFATQHAQISLVKKTQKRQKTREVETLQNEVQSLEQGSVFDDFKTTFFENTLTKAVLIGAGSLTATAFSGGSIWIFAGIGVCGEFLLNFANRKLEEKGGVGGVVEKAIDFAIEKVLEKYDKKKEQWKEENPFIYESVMLGENTVKKTYRGVKYLNRKAKNLQEKLPDASPDIRALLLLIIVLLYMYYFDGFKKKEVKKPFYREYGDYFTEYWEEEEEASWLDFTWWKVATAVLVFFFFIGSLTPAKTVQTMPDNQSFLDVPNQDDPNTDDEFSEEEETHKVGEIKVNRKEEEEEKAEEAVIEQTPEGVDNLPIQQGGDDFSAKMSDFMGRAKALTPEVLNQK